MNFKILCIKHIFFRTSALHVLPFYIPSIDSVSFFRRFSSINVIGTIQWLKSTSLLCKRIASPSFHVYKGITASKIVKKLAMNIDCSIISLDLFQHDHQMKEKLLMWSIRIGTSIIVRFQCYLKKQTMTHTHMMSMEELERQTTSTTCMLNKICFDVKKIKF